MGAMAVGAVMVGAMGAAAMAVVAVEASDAPEGKGPCAPVEPVVAEAFIAASGNGKDGKERNDGVGGAGGAGGVGGVGGVGVGGGKESMLPLISTATAALSNVFQSNASKVRQFHPACQAAAQAEVRLAASLLFHSFYPEFDTPSRLPGHGSCRVQLLRSVGKWSTGTRTEHSILSAYLDAIKNSTHLVYIENQFFVGSTAGEGVVNDVPKALLERILLAHKMGHAFKVIIIIPVHPNGDFASALKSKVVMHYEYATINRGLQSMFSQLRLRAPGIDIACYIGFYSLKNWGLINNKVVSNQIYVHDKLLIADDRVLIIGSANINDRSMLGNRDSELAIRIEDTLHATVTMAGVPFTVGFLPHTLRVKLMRQHIDASESVDLSDPFSPFTTELWDKTAKSNTAVYDSLDGNTSVYRCTTTQQFKSALAAYNNPSYLDPDVKHSVAEIKGFLINWPQTLLENEDLSPSLATRTLVPNELWV
mmetsp:Transcript_13874/g.30604  ORF Transcript_13874/g.30604 Transcript_13874/m.30604 type:complete len:479 (+) Transcript_13874:1-1437(+)